MRSRKRIMRSLRARKSLTYRTMNARSVSTICKIKRPSTSIISLKRIGRLYTFTKIRQHIEMIGFMLRLLLMLKMKKSKL